MVTAIIELGIGYFVTYNVSEILGLKGTPAKIIKTVGIVLLILGFINLVESIANLIPQITN